MKVRIDCRFAAVLLVAAVSACNTQPIYTVQDHSIPGTSRGLKTEEITQAIQQTAQANGWLVERVGPRELRAMQKWRGHSATITITHDDQRFSIQNAGSTNLRQQDEEIHRSYNQRVKALENAIELRLYRNS